MTQGYTCQSRFWDDPEAPLVTKIWYPTDLPFLDVPTVFGSREWETDYPDLDGLGEVRRDRAARKNWHPGIPGLAGDHVCGTPDQFMLGAPDYTGPPIVYDADHIPVCCRRRQVAFVTGGAQPAAISTPIYNTRSRVTGGARPAAIVTQIHAPPSSSTSGARPASTVSQDYTLTADVTGGAQPAATVSTDYTLTADVTGGAQPAAIVEVIPAPSASVTAGARPSSYVSTVVMCPAPHEFCASSLLGRINVNCDVEYVPLNENSWRAWATVPGHTYRLRTESALGTMAWELYEGEDCSSLTLLTTGDMGGTPEFDSWVATKTRAYLHWSYPFGTHNHVIIGVDDIT